MTTFELDYRKFEWDSQRHQIYTKFKFKIEEVFENLRKEDVYM